MDVKEKDEVLRLSESILLGGLYLSFAGCVCLFPGISQFWYPAHGVPISLYASRGWGLSVCVICQGWQVHI